jgi:hypothetical protein
VPPINVPAKKQAGQTVFSAGPQCPRPRCRRWQGRGRRMGWRHGSERVRSGYGPTGRNGTQRDGTGCNGMSGFSTIPPNCAPQADAPECATQSSHGRSHWFKSSIAHPTSLGEPPIVRRASKGKPYPSGCDISRSSGLRMCREYGMRICRGYGMRMCRGYGMRMCRGYGMRMCRWRGLPVGL